MFVALLLSRIALQLPKVSGSLFHNYTTEVSGFKNIIFEIEIISQSIACGNVFELVKLKTIFRAI